MITLDDGEQTKTFDEFGFYAQWSHKKPRSGAITRKTEHIPGVAGDWYFGSEIGSKTYSLNLLAWERDWNKFENLSDELNSFFFDSEGQPKLIRATWTNSKRFLYMRLASEIKPNVASVIEEIELGFVADNPHEYQSFDGDEVGWGSQSITFEESLLLGANGGEPVKPRLINGSTSIAFEVEGLSVKPQITLIGTGSNIMINCGMHYINVGNLADEEVTVDCENLVIYRNGAEDLPDMSDFVISKDYPTVEIKGSALDIQLLVQYRNKYM